jgi:hypothetical protein
MTELSDLFMIYSDLSDTSELQLLNVSRVISTPISLIDSNYA